MQCYSTLSSERDYAFLLCSLSRNRECATQVKVSALRSLPVTLAHTVPCRCGHEGFRMKYHSDSLEYELNVILKFSMNQKRGF